MKTLITHFWSALLYDEAFGKHFLLGLVAVAVLLFLLRALRKWPVLQPVLHALVYDEAAVKRWLFGIGSFLATLASMVFIGGVDQALTWTGRQWFTNIFTAFIALVFGMLNPAAKKAASADAPAAPSAAGFVRVAVLAAIAAGVVTGLLSAVALHAAGLNGHGWMMLVLAAAVAQGWLVVKAFPASPDEYI